MKEQVKVALEKEAQGKMMVHSGMVLDQSKKNQEFNICIICEYYNTLGVSLNIFFACQ